MENLTGGIEEGLRFAVFARGVVLRGGYLAASVVRDELAAVADAENRKTEGENLRVNLR